MLPPGTVQWMCTARSAALRAGHGRAGLNPALCAACSTPINPVIAGLCRFRSLFVVGRNSSFAFRDHQVNHREISSALGVRYILNGSVRRSGGHVRISSHLIDAETGTDTWSERYDRELGDLFSVQDEVTDAIVQAIAPKIGDAERDRAQFRLTACAIAPQEPLSPSALRSEAKNHQIAPNSNPRTVNLRPIMKFFVRNKQIYFLSDQLHRAGLTLSEVAILTGLGTRCAAWQALAPSQEVPPPKPPDFYSIDRS